MRAALRVLRLLAAGVWVGGLVYFAFVVAPVSFKVLPTRHLAGLVVAGTLAILNRMGEVCSLVLALTLFPSCTRGSQRRALYVCELACILAMLVATVCVQWRIVPAMERDRLAVGGDLDSAPPDNTARMDFERLHSLSESVEGAALLVGVGLVVLIGVEPSPVGLRRPEHPRA